MGRLRNKLQQEQDQARESRQRMLDATLELLTSDAISSEQMRESAMALVYLEPKILAEIDRIRRSYDEPKTREVRVALLLGIALPCVLWGCSREMGKIFTFVRRTFRSSTGCCDRR
jgi:hypothetical protein